MVKELLAKLNRLLSRERKLLSKPLPERDGESESSFPEMEDTFRRLQALEKEYLVELTRLAADKAREKELLRELTFLQELQRKREENMALGQERLENVGKELDRVQAEKKARLAYRPEKKRKNAGFVDSKS